MKSFLTITNRFVIYRFNIDYKIIPEDGVIYYSLYDPFGEFKTIQKKEENAEI